MGALGLAMGPSVSQSETATAIPAMNCRVGYAIRRVPLA